MSKKEVCSKLEKQNCFRSVLSHFVIQMSLQTVDWNLWSEEVLQPSDGVTFYRALFDKSALSDGRQSPAARSCNSLLRSSTAEIGQRQFYAWMTFGHFNCDFSTRISFSKHCLLTATDNLVVL